MSSPACQILGLKKIKGNRIHRRGLAKKSGGIGMHVTAVTRRYFKPNLFWKRVWVTELNKWVRIKTSARGLKTINKNGAFETLKKAGLIDKEIAEYKAQKAAAQAAQAAQA